MPENVQRPLAISLPEIGLLVAESVHGPGFQMGPERHDFHEIYVVRKGHITLEDERQGAPLRINAGSLWPIPSGTLHRMEDTAESVLLLICISKEHILRDGERERAWNALIARHQVAIRPDSFQFDAVMDCLYRILAEQWQPRAGSLLLTVAEIDRLLVLLTRTSTASTVDTAESRVRHVAVLMETQFFETWDIDRASARSHLSRRRFTTLFRQITGESFNQRLGRLRIQHAKALLRDGRHSIPGAALACGVQDLSHFYRMFKRETGMSPGRWLREREGNHE